MERDEIPKTTKMTTMTIMQQSKRKRERERERERDDDNDNDNNITIKQSERWQRGWVDNDDIHSPVQNRIFYTKMKMMTATATISMQQLNSERCCGGSCNNDVVRLRDIALATMMSKV